MLNLENYDDVVEITDTSNTTLQENEYLLKVHDDIGFMTKLTKKNEIPPSFTNWRQYWNHQNTVKTYVIEEKFREGWKFYGLRHGQSTAWVMLQHPYGFVVEINPSAFEDIVGELTMVNGVIITPCYFQAKAKNAKLLVEKNNKQDYLYSLIRAVSDDTNLVERLKDVIEDERPDKVYSVISPI